MLNHIRMSKKLLLALALIFGITPLMNAQEIETPCGTVGEFAELVTQRLLENKAALRAGKVPEGRAIEYVPIRFHIVGRSDGSGKIQESRVFDQLCALNEDYLPVEIQFYLSVGSDGSLFNYIENTTVFDSPGSAAGKLFMSQAKVNNAVNIFIPNNASTGGGGLGVTLGYYDPQSDWIVVRKANIGAGDVTMPHEMGHFLSLPHPHNGWDQRPYDPDLDGTPAPVISIGGVATENADGSNCETAGDFICDTPADYNGFGQSGCIYNGGALDPQGEPIDPEELLYMGYYLNCPVDNYFFSEDQMDLMTADLYSSQRDYIRPGITPNLTAVTNAPELVSPMSASTVSGYQNVMLDWETIPGADYYFLEVDNLPNFSTANVQKYVITGNSSANLNLQASTTYFWRVTALNAYSSCGGVSSSRSFITDDVAVNVQEITAINTWTAFPNPTTGQSELNINVEANNAFEANVRLLNVGGQMVQDLGIRAFANGSNSFTVNVADLPQGVYTISMTSAEGTSNKRIVVTK